MTAVQAPLAGLRIADFSRVLAGPYATQRLADLGADVVKVERPGSGDETRSWGPPFRDGTSSYFTSLNRGKRSLALDLGSVDGREVAAALCRTSDVVVHNFLPAVAERIGLRHEVLEGLRPDVISCAISGFGSMRLPADRPGYDLVVQAESGLMSITGERGGGPTKVGVALVDVLTGLEAATAILAALAGRSAGRGGAAIEVPLLDSALAALVNVGQGALDSGSEPDRYGNDHPSIVPYGSFEAADGAVVVAAANDGIWLRMCEAIGAEDLADDPRFATNPDRVRNREVLLPELGARFRRVTAAGLVELLSAAGVPCGRVLGVIEAIGHASSSGEDPVVGLEGGVAAVGPPARFDGARLHAGRRPPRLGEHGDEVLAELGFAPQRVAELRAAGTVG